MNRPGSIQTLLSRFLLLLTFLTLTVSLTAQRVELSAFQFPERGTTELPMIRSWRIPEASMLAKIRFRDGQNRIELSYDQMKPAVLFSGDVTCYVLWAVARDGTVENLGEVWVRPERRKDSIEFSTPLRNFALLVTAEPYYQVPGPSSMIVFESGTVEGAASTPVTLDSLGDPPQAGVESLANISYDGKTPLDIVQAQRLFQLAQREGARQYAASLFEEAKSALQQAEILSSRNDRKKAQVSARQSVAASNDAIRVSIRASEAARLEAEIESRQNEMAELERQARDSQREAEATRRRAEEAIAELERKRSQTQAQLRQIDTERREAEASLSGLRQEQANLEASVSRLREDLTSARNESRALEGQLQSALSQIADTQQSAEGFIVNLPDILFAFNEAELKPEARVVIAKLAGIALIMQDLTLRIEGHTDATGTDEYNLELSQKRADSVLSFLADNGIDPGRMSAVGKGKSDPIGDNDTAEGRRRNRRVEIIVIEG